MKKSQEFSRLGKPSEPSSISSQPCNRASAARVGDAGLRCRARKGCLRGRPPLRGTAGRRAGSSSLDSPSSKFQIVPSRTHGLHKPLRAAEIASACRLPLSVTAPIFISLPPDEFSCLAWPVQRPAHVRQKICAVDFPPTSPQRHKSALPIFPTGGMTVIAPISRPTVFFVKPWTVQSRDLENTARSRPSLHDVVP